jgi:hypothetical protein
MNLPAPITLPIKEITISKLEFVLMDNSSKKLAVAALTAIPASITLWSGEDYDAAGDYTQAAVEARILEILGPDPGAKLKSLIPKNIP